MAEGTLTPPAPLAMKDLITEAGLADRAYLKDYLEKPLDKDTGLALLKKLDGAETLIGKKTLIPDDKADPKDVDAFYSKLRPAKPEDYDFKLGEGASPEFDKALRAAAHKSGVDKRQMGKFITELLPIFQDHAKKQGEANAAHDAEFDTMLKLEMGDGYEKRVARAKAAAAELVPASAKKFVGKMDDNSLVLFTVFADALLKKYAGEDDFGSKDNGGGGGNANANDKEALIKELHTLYASEGWKNFQHSDHEKTKKRVDEILASPVFK